MARIFSTISFLAVALMFLTLSYATKRTMPLDLAVSRRHNAQQSVGTGTITGRVVNARGVPVSGVIARVYSLPLIKQRPASALSDETGGFTIKGLQVGRYEISLSKKEAGYGDTFDPFYAAGFVRMPEVVVYEGQTASCGDVPLGPKAGKLIGTIRDTTSRKGIVVSSGPEQTRHVILCRLDNPKNCSDANPRRNGDFEILVPPVPFTIKASAPGYESRNLGPLRLRGGEIRRLDILLKSTSE